MIDNVRTGQNIAAHRQRLGWTQGELAGRLNVTHQAVSKWENGIAFPDIGTLYALSQLFGVSMEALLTGEPVALSLPSQEPPVISEEADLSSAPAVEKTADSEEPPLSGASAYNWDEIISLAPFASRDTLDQLVAQCEETCDHIRILDLAPFAHRDTIDRLVCKSSDCADWDFILSLAPFASRDTLDQLVAQCETACDREHLHALAPFLARDTIDRLILGSIGRSTPLKPSPRPAKHWQDGLAAWSEAQERQMEDAVAWAEEHEQQMEQSAHMAETIEKLTEAAMRKAERIAEREMERAARRAERLAEKQLDRAARHADRAIRYSDERHTQIVDAVPACSDLDECIAPECPEEQASLCPDEEILPDPDA